MPRYASDTRYGALLCLDYPSMDIASDGLGLLLLQVELKNDKEVVMKALATNPDENPVSSIPSEWHAWTVVND